ncbi:MAG: LEA type 2 family protein [Desulfobacterales bacterium]|jgi:LEA14-like dessication related protein|nr:LEA type 2 family protein [Desulfobacterales bacterium]
MMQTFKLQKGIIVTVFFLVYIFGCAGMGQRLEPPRVKLANIRLEAFNVLETVFDVQLRVFNTNETALQIRGVESELSINGKAFAIGVSESDVDVPAYGTALVPLRVYSSVFDIIKSAAGLHNQEELRYHIKGKLRLGANTFPRVLPFESEGNISLPDIPELKERRPPSD